MTAQRSEPQPQPERPPPPSDIERERQSLSAHREALRGSPLPPPKDAPPGTFLHGFALPFTLIVATLRHPTLGMSYLRLTVGRAIVVSLLAYAAFANSHGAKPPAAAPPHGPHIVTHHDKGHKGDHAKPKESHDPVHVAAPGVKIDIDEATGEKKMVVLGQDVPIADAEKAANEEIEKKQREEDSRPVVLKKIALGWSWILWFLGIVSATEAIVIFFTRRWDDWLGFHASSVARILPEDATPKDPRLAFDIAWLFRKLKRRVRGYLVFAAGVPLLLLLKLMPGHIAGVMLGDVLFSISLTLWGWYWLAVFTAAKSAHAWVDQGAPSPRVIREIRDRCAGRWWLTPVRLYGRFWGWVTSSMNPAAITFERNPRPFLGLALARAILALPGLYLLARPVVPIAAGRLIAESDPADRFSVR